MTTVLYCIVLCCDVLCGIYLLRHQKTKPSPEYGSRQRATSRDGYSSHCSFMARHSSEAAACDIYTTCKATIHHSDNVYGAVIMAEPLWEFTRFIWWMWNGAKRLPTQDQDRQLRLWLRLYRLPESTPTIAIYYYYSARKLILILPSHEGQKAESN